MLNVEADVILQSNKK